MKIFISIFRLYKFGGIESSAINLINEIKNDNEITLCVLTDIINKKMIIPNGIHIQKGSNLLRDTFVSRDSLEDQSFPQKMVRNFRRFKRRVFGTKKVLINALKKIKINESYDVAISFINDKYDKNGKMISGGDYDFVSANINAKRKIAWIHANPHLEGYSYNVSKSTFATFDAIVNVSIHCKTIFDSIIDVYEKKSYVVYNMYNIDQMQYLASLENPYENYKENKLQLVTVSRLDNFTKRLDRIINVCTRLRDANYINFCWTIVGEGPSKNELVKMIHDNNLSKNIIMAGDKSNPFPYMKYADLYVSTSAYESFGMSVREAQILECPVLITDIGPSNELVNDGINGIICDNSTMGLFNMIKTVLDNPKILKNIKHSLEQQPFTNNLAVKQFNEVCNNF